MCDPLEPYFRPIGRLVLTFGQLEQAVAGFVAAFVTSNSNVGKCHETTRAGEVPCA